MKNSRKITTPIMFLAAWAGITSQWIINTIATWMRLKHDWQVESWERGGEKGKEGESGQGCSLIHGKAGIIIGSEPWETQSKQPFWMSGKKETERIKESGREQEGNRKRQTASWSDRYNEHTLTCSKTWMKPAPTENQQQAQWWSSIFYL